MSDLLNSDLFAYFVLPLLICLSRVVDVSLGTLRIIFLSKGDKLVAPILGLFEVTIWLLAITRIMQNLDNWVCFVAYPVGFALGNYIGIWIDEKLAVGELVVRVITQRNANKLIDHLKEEEFGFTVMDAKGSKEDVSVIFAVIERDSVAKFKQLVRQFNPKAFITTQPVRLESKGIFHHKRKSLFSLRPGRKGK